MKYNKPKAIFYFIQQKIFEITPWILGILAFIYVPYLVARIMTTFYPDYVGSESIIAYWMAGFVTTGIFTMCLLCLILLVAWIYFSVLKDLIPEIVIWIEDNWDRAKKRARIK